MNDLSNTDSIPSLSLNPSPTVEAAKPPEWKRKEAASQSAFEIYDGLIKDNISYDILKQDTQNCRQVNTRFLFSSLHRSGSQLPFVAAGTLLTGRTLLVSRSFVGEAFCWVSASALLVDDADAFGGVIIERKDPLVVHTGIPDIIGERRSIHIFNFV